jgi:hypothetical protein
MHAWEGNPKLDESSEYRSEVLAPERSRARAASGRPYPLNWKVLAGLAAGSLLGVPFLAPGTVHAAWAQLLQMLAFLRR